MYRSCIVQIFHLYALTTFLFYRKYYGANRALPSKIIIYRNGDGSGDIARLEETEVAAVKVDLVFFFFFFFF